MIVDDSLQYQSETALKTVTFRYFVGVVTLKMHKSKRSLAVSKKEISEESV